MMTPRPDMIRALAAELAAGRTTGVALTEAALAHALAHRAADGAAYVSLDARAALDMARAADAARGRNPVCLQRYRHVVARKRQHGLTTTLIYATTPIQTKHPGNPRGMPG